MSNPRFKTPSAVDFEAMVESLFESGYVPDTSADVESERFRREQNLQKAAPPIPPEDYESLIAGAINTNAETYPAAFWARQFYLVAKKKKKARDGRPMRFLVLLGPTSRGKTFAGSYLLASEGGIYINARAFFRLATSQHYKERGKLDELHRTRCLLIDDLGTEDAFTDELAAKMQGAIWEATNERQVDGAITVMTGNMSPDDFSKRYGERTVRRVEHQGMMVWCEGTDLRRPPLVIGGRP